jgi:hypothetical protein
MSNLSWGAVLAGAVIFVAAHATEVAARIGGSNPWFISSLPPALLTSGVMFIAAFAIGWRSPHRFVDAFVAGVSLAAGATLPLVITLFMHPGGPGNLFPLAISVGIALLTVTSVAGVSAGWLMKRAFR